jgi:hypothetical protein
MIFGMMHLVPPKLDIFSAWFGLTERGPTANGWAANSAHLVAARPAHLDRGRRSDPTEDGVRASLKRLNGGEGETLAHFSSPLVPSSRRGGGERHRAPWSATVPAPVSAPLPVS